MSTAAHTSVINMVNRRMLLDKHGKLLHDACAGASLLGKEIIKREVSD